MLAIYQSLQASLVQEVDGGRYLELLLVHARSFPRNGSFPSLGVWPGAQISAYHELINTL